MTQRRLPRWSELRPLLAPRPPELDPTARRLARAASIADLRAIARRRAPRAVFDYADGAADTEVGLRRAREAFTRVELVPSILRDVSAVDASTTIFGRPASLPLAFAPTGFTRLFHHEGERAVARVAERDGHPRRPVDRRHGRRPRPSRRRRPTASKWFQLYMWPDRDASAELIGRARTAGFHVLALTVDVPVAGSRLRDVHNGLVFPPRPTLRTLGDMALHPSWWANMLTTEPLRFASLKAPPTTVARVASLFDAALKDADIGWLRELWDGPLVIKGVLTAEDARRVIDLGADGVVVSSHGARQLDLSPTPLEVLPEIVEAIGDRAEVFLDSGILTGADIVAAVAMGARACLVARAYCYGLMAAGERGVQHAHDLLRAEIVRTLALLGVSAVSDLTPDRVRLRPPGA